ncbi:hypothetical protein LMJ38_35330 [Streptomyces sp. R1]|uniref:carbamoyl-phosphate synthase domain-containing protein n=1 Tax=Streptomyces sp. R1 TaxID=1509279 RepID=UPI001E4FCED1|nr:carbamoyl-phosphate synthase domain-containing protein [Streptomyces sp. R1]MCC8341159.1 hypothetical protein [Streptomyces sp. R1]
MPDPIVTNDYLDAVLILSHGDFFLGKGIGVLGETQGEICFNTGLTGYQETITDPSFAGQLITFTFPHSGNVGTTPVYMESTRPFCKGIIIRDAITAPSNFRSQAPLQDFLQDTKLTGISGVDTRELTLSGINT